MKEIGFIGLGIMGKPMAKNLLKAGYRVYTYDVNYAEIDKLVEAGGIGCSSIEEVAVSCSTIVTMLPNSPQVKEVILGEGGIAQYAAKGTLIIDMSSIAPDASKEISAAIAPKGIRLIDAPVSGGEPKAVDGTLAIMAGGSPEDFQEAQPVFEVLGSSAVLVGDVGSGNTCKLANQIIVAGNITVLSEAMMLAKKAGTDPEKVFHAISQGLAGSTVMNAKAPMMLAGNYKPGFKIDLHIKDLNNALETGYKSGAPLLLSAQIMQMLQTLHQDGEGASDHSALMKYYEKIAGTTLKEE